MLLGFHCADMCSDWVNEFLKTLDPAGVAGRQLGAAVVHGHGLHSLGPDEEWSLDGHDKTVRPMGIAVWGIIDKFSRKTIGLFAVPNNRLADTTLACFLLLVQRSGGRIIKFNPKADILTSLILQGSQSGLSATRVLRPGRYMLFRQHSGNVLYT
jgi:hypothetical protein